VTVLCVRFGSWISLHFAFLRDEEGFPWLFRGPLGLSLTVAPEHLRGIRWDPAGAGAG
jgi:hypothetical protein